MAMKEMVRSMDGSHSEGLRTVEILENIILPLEIETGMDETRVS